MVIEDRIVEYVQIKIKDIQIKIKDKKEKSRKYVTSKK